MPVERPSEHTDRLPLPSAEDDGEVWLIALMIAQGNNGGEMLSQVNLREAARLVARYEVERKAMDEQVTPSDTDAPQEPIEPTPIEFAESLQPSQSYQLINGGEGGSRGGNGTTGRSGFAAVGGPSGGGGGAGYSSASDGPVGAGGTPGRSGVVAFGEFIAGGIHCGAGRGRATAVPGYGSGGGAGARDGASPSQRVTTGPRFIITDGEHEAPIDRPQPQPVSFDEPDRRRQQKERTATSRQHPNFAAVQEWCEENDWSDPQLINGEWWGFQDGAAMPAPMDCKPKQQITEAEFWERFTFALRAICLRRITSFTVHHNSDQQVSHCCVIVDDRMPVKFSIESDLLDDALRAGTWRQLMIDTVMLSQRAIDA